MSKTLSYFVSFIIIIIAYQIYKWGQPSSPPIQPPLKYSVVNDILSELEHKNLINLFEDLGEFPSAKQDSSTTKWSTIGEEYEPTNNECSKPFTLLNNKTKKCDFPGRIDIARHFIYYGGYHGLKESYSNLMDRTNLFVKFWHFDHDTNPRKEYIDLFKLKKFQNAISDICGDKFPYFRPYVFQSTLLLPGQLIPYHLDASYFISNPKASRYQFPIWLLSVMHGSGLFEKQRIHQVQIIVYIHDWKLNSNFTSFYKFGGQFITHPYGAGYRSVTIPATPKSAVFLDGATQKHAVSIFKSGTKPLKFNKDLTSFMKYDKLNNLWRLYVDNTATNNTYNWSNIRASVITRGWCFKDKNTMDSYNPKSYNDTDDMTLNEIMNILKNDLIQNKKLINLNKWNSMSQYDKGIFLMDQYLNLPKPQKSIIPINYCLIFTQLPKWRVLNFVKNIFCSHTVF